MANQQNTPNKQQQPRNPMNERDESKDRSGQKPSERSAASTDDRSSERQNRP